MRKYLYFLTVCVTLQLLANVVYAANLIDPLGGGDFTTVICRIVTYISQLIAALAVLVFLWAGILFVTSAGNPNQIDKAKKALIYGVVGSAIALVGAGLIEFIKMIIGAGGGGGC